MTRPLLPTQDSNSEKEELEKFGNIFFENDVFILKKPKDIEEESFLKKIKKIRENSVNIGTERKKAFIVFSGEHWEVYTLENEESELKKAKIRSDGLCGLTSTIFVHNFFCEDEAKKLKVLEELKDKDKITTAEGNIHEASSSNNLIGTIQIKRDSQNPTQIDSAVKGVIVGDIAERKLIKDFFGSPLKRLAKTEQLIKNPSNTTYWFDQNDIEEGLEKLNSSLKIANCLSGKEDLKPLKLFYSSEEEIDEKIKEAEAKLVSTQISDDEKYSPESDSRRSSWRLSLPTSRLASGRIYRAVTPLRWDSYRRLSEDESEEEPSLLGGDSDSESDSGIEQIDLLLRRRRFSTSTPTPTPTKTPLPANKTLPSPSPASPSSIQLDLKENSQDLYGLLREDKLQAYIQGLNQNWDNCRDVAKFMPASFKPEANKYIGFGLKIECDYSANTISIINDDKINGATKTNVTEITYKTLGANGLETKTLDIKSFFAEIRNKYGVKEGDKSKMDCALACFFRNRALNDEEISFKTQNQIQNEGAPKEGNLTPETKLIEVENKSGVITKKPLTSNQEEKEKIAENDKKNIGEILQEIQNNKSPQI